MMKVITAAVVVWLALLGIAVPALRADTVVLEPGESFQAGDHNVTCVLQRRAQPLALSECQYWDDFDKKCLQERKVLSVGKLNCVEECQHWDEFNKVCEYATTCTFYPAQGGFIRTTCAEFDTYAHRCLRVHQEKLGGR